ncbi:MAG TPA: D-alanyl-D-alanine carboxypeptidase/D-alanyl-D-alanine-endopeptidase [Chthonomonadaceae bacterium]|nr:D-alanyl-D-alanine carboxypeptidase/D-alanyl-D-alanine-endopeptidase [Chthonomonadaceae bacterium]
MKRSLSLPSRRAWIALAVLCTLVLFPLSVQGQTPPVSPDPELTKALDALLDGPELQTGFCGVCIQSLQDQSVLYERNADRVFLPASNNKLLTSAAALGILGPDFTYTTRLAYTGTLDADGTLNGDLYLHGSGDPTLTLTDLDALAQQAANAGLKRVTGALHYDDTLFDRQFLGEGWEWDDEAGYDAAQISALNINHNVALVTVTPGRKEGERPKVHIQPEAHYVTVVNTAVTGPAKSKFTLIVDRPRGLNTILVFGSIPRDTPADKPFTVNVSVEDPALYAATLCASSLAKAEVRLENNKPSVAAVPTHALTLAEHVSPPLSELLKRMNKPSDNLMAECLLKTVGAARKGQGTGGGGGTGAQAAREWLGSLGLDLSRLRQCDGSGLSRQNYVSPRNLARLLAGYHSRPDFEIFYASLPIAGVDGTLRSRLKTTPAANNCRAKTGSLRNVSTLSGYVTTKDGELLAFSLLMNNNLVSAASDRAVQDKIVALLAAYTRKHETGDTFP